MLHSCLEHLLVTHFVLPVTDVWQFDPWWIPKLRDQPTLGPSPKFLLLSSPLNRFGSCGVRQSIQFIFSDNTNFVLQQSLIQSDFVVYAYWLDVSISVRMQIRKESKFATHIRNEDLRMVRALALCKPAHTRIPKA